MDPIVRAVPPAGSTTTKSFSIAATAAFMACANLIIWFPGESGPDSQSQYQQVVAAQFDDWHPPIMAWLWSIFRPLADGNAPMFCFQVVLYWLGFSLIAITLARAGRTLAAWAILGVALLPPFLRLNVVLLKDVGMAVTFLSAFAASFWYWTQDRKAPAAVTAMSLALLFYGALVRANAVFAVVPLFVYMIRPQWLGRPWQLLAVSIPIASALIPAANLFNHRVLHAEPLEAIRSLQTFDITGIAFYSDDLTVFGRDNPFTRDEVTGCYNPRGWDSISPWGECRFFWNRLAVSRDLQGVIENLNGTSAMRAEHNPDLLDLWVAAIIRHPLAYVTHRLANFSSEMTAPPYLNFNAKMMAPPCRMIYDVLTAPALWLTIGAGLLVQLAWARSLRRSASTDAALALLLSSLPYSCAFLVIGVGTESRYLFWSLIAIFAAAVISMPLGRPRSCSCNMVAHRIANSSSAKSMCANKR
jgi:hypothetical protein